MRAASWAGVIGSEVLQDGADHRARHVAAQAVHSGAALVEIGLGIDADLVTLAHFHAGTLEQYRAAFAVGESKLQDDVGLHAGGAAGYGIVNSGIGAEVHDRAGEDSVGDVRVGDDCVASAYDELARDVAREAVGELVALGYVAEGGDGYGFDVLGEEAGSAGDVVAAG